ncbi:NEDD8-specific protease 1 [Carex littledalei]|uniref:NEDD8-specific protease 1 n=1 Tax=Carex littledalei TaxID=544730 RepID=A0A833QMR7_9POAL|nr:NEDD8-specific protease 1 [Carex littledalei]
MAPPSGDDDRILTYGDSTVVRSDLSILCGPHYLNDRLIHFFFSHLAVSCSYPDDILLLRDKALVLFPVNDNPDVNLAEGGSHWSLLICHVPSREFVHHDSSGCLNSVHAYKLYQLVQHFVGDVQFGYHEGPIPRQTNGYDCGLYVMAIARCVCEWYCKVKNNGSADGKEKWFDVLREQLNGDKVHELRGELLSLVLKLTQQNDLKKRGHVKLRVFQELINAIKFLTACVRKRKLEEKKLKP